MTLPSEDAVRSQKLGSENAIVVQLPSERFVSSTPPHHRPLVDDQDRCTVMLLAQDCRRCSFGGSEAGPTHELHVWLLVGSSKDAPPIENADSMLPSKDWLALVAATDNPQVETNLRSFGFDPLRLASVALHSSGGSVELQDHARLEWTIAGPGSGPARLGVHHTMFMPDDGPDAAGHRVAALISDAVMAHPAELQVHGSSLEPFLLSGERLPALVHRMPKLEADVVWHRRPRAS
jgi:hypothetical protein